LLAAFAAGTPARATGPGSNFTRLTDKTFTSPDRQMRVQQYWMGPEVQDEFVRGSLARMDKLGVFRHEKTDGSRVASPGLELATAPWRKFK
jgi:hypothetical protein